MKGVEILDEKQKEKIKKHLLEQLLKINSKSVLSDVDLKVKSAISETLFKDFNVKTPLK